MLLTGCDCQRKNFGSFDARGEKISLKSLFRRAKKLELNYRSQLRKIARHIGDIAFAHDAETPEGVARILAGMRAYAHVLDPWADSVGNRMVAEIAAADRAAWRKTSATMGRLLHKEIETAPTGAVMRAALERQVTLITSLPLEAAQRVHKLTTEGITQGRRAADVAKEIMRSGEVTRSRADLIARTEVSRTATELTRARAMHIGSTHYVWRTVHDQSVRHDHKILDGRTFAWDDPPIADQRTGARAHPGCIYACRCYPEPVIPED